MELFTLDASGTPVSCGTDWLTWADGQFTIAKTAVGPGTVSTIFLGFRSGPWDPPALFETMTFGIPSLEADEERTPTRDAALEAHRRAVARAERVVREVDAPLLP